MTPEERDTLITKLKKDLKEEKEKNDLHYKARVYDALWDWFNELRYEEGSSRSCCCNDEMSDRVRQKCRNQDLYQEYNLLQVIEEHFYTPKVKVKETDITKNN